MAITFIAATTALTATTKVDTTITCTLPSTVAGDVVVAWIDAIDTSGVNPALTNSAWTLVGTVADVGTPTPYGSLWYRVIQPGDASTAVWTSTGAVTFLGAMVMSAYRGVDNTAPVLQSFFDTLVATTTARSVAMTTSASAWVLSGFSDKTAGVAFSSPSHTLRGQARQLTNGLPTVMLQDSNGAVAAGAQTHTAVGASTSVANSFMLALKPATQASLMPGGVQDSFTGSNGTTLANTNWAITTSEGSGYSWTIQGNQARLTTGTAVNNRISVRVNRATLADGEAVFDWVVPASSTMYPAFYARAGSALNGDGGYYFLLNSTGGQIVMGKWVPNYTGNDLSTVSYSFTVGNIMRTRVAVFGSRIRMRTWLASNSEPTGVWDMDFTDSGTQPTTGYWGFTNAAQTSGSKNFFIDNFNLLDTITPSQQSITVGGTISMAGALIKQVPKAFAGSITMSGVYSKIKVVSRIFGGSITMAGALKRNAAKSLGGSITPSGVVKRNVTKKLTGSITMTGSFGRRARKVFSGSITPTGATVITYVGRVFGYPGILVMRVFKPGDLRIRFRRG